MKTEREDLINDLKAMLEREEVTTLYTALHHVSQSGMSRNISVHFVSKDRKICQLDWYVEKILGYKRAKNSAGVRVGGCGMDMGFHVVYTLSSVLFKGEERAGYKLNQEWI